MATYQELPIDEDLSPEDLGLRALNMLAGAYSVEIINSPRVIRVWFEDRDDLGQHQKT